MPPLKLRLVRPRHVVVLLALVAIMTLAPILQNAAHPAMTRMMGALGIFVSVLAVSAAGDKGWPRRIAIGLAILCALLNADVTAGLTSLPPQLGIAVSLMFLAFTTLRLIAGVGRSRIVTSDVIAGAVTSYMMVGLTWACAYGLMETVRPGSIQGPSGAINPLDFPTLLYFSYITLLTIGYGDITPVTAAARMLAVFEGLVGVMFTTIVLAVLVAAYLGQRRDAGSGGAGSEP